MSFLSYYMIGMFSYGFLRSFRSEYFIERHNLIGTKFCYSCMNGMFYATPFGIPYLFNTLNRLDIYIFNKDPSKYPEAYIECCGASKNKNVLF